LFSFSSSKRNLTFSLLIATKHRVSIEKERETKKKDQNSSLKMGTLQSWRRAYGAIKDTTKVGLAHVNSDYAVPIFSRFFFFFSFFINRSINQIL
jgi:hypothetical protein